MSGLLSYYQALQRGPRGPFDRENFRTYPAGAYGTGTLLAPRWTFGGNTAVIANNRLELSTHHPTSPGLRHDFPTGGRYNRVLVPLVANESNRRFIMQPNANLGAACYIAFYFTGSSVVAASCIENAQGHVVDVPEYSSNALPGMALSTTEASWVETHVPKPLLPGSVIEWRVWGESQPRPAAPGFTHTHDAALPASDEGTMCLRSINGETAYLLGIQLAATAATPPSLI
jgi:hypothetical protein